MPEVPTKWRKAAFSVQIHFPFFYFIMDFHSIFYVRELRHIIITCGFSWFGLTLFSQSTVIWSVGSEESSSSSGRIRALLDWASPPRERDMDAVFSLGGKPAAQASSSHLATDARLPAAGEPAPSPTLPQENPRAVPPANPAGEAGPAGQFVPYPYYVNQVIGGDSVSYIQRRLLEQWGERTPGYEVLQRALYAAQDHFELKVEILTKN